MATATSTLILALQARNESQAAFAEIRAAMQEQVTQAREASAQQQTAVKASAEQQLLAVKQGLAQQVLAQRQALEQQVAAIRASGTGNVDAQVLAAKQGYEQQVLAAKDAAEQKALAIKTGMAQELDAVRAGLAQQVDAQKVAGAEQVAAVRAQAAEEAIALRAEAAEAAASAREGGLLRRVPLIGGALAGAGERLEGPLDLAKSAIGITAGLAAITAVVEGLHELPRAFAEAATEGQSFQVQMTNFYGTMQAAGQVLEYTNVQASKMPFSLDAIRSSTAALATTGQDVQQLLPALGNIAAAMHTDLPTAAAAFNRALLTGNMRGLVSQLHLSKQELEDFGLQVDSKGKIIGSTLAPALERLAASRFGDAMAREGNTAQGALIRLHNQWELFKETAGEGLFAGLKGTLAGVANWLNTHQAAVRGFAAAVGSALGTMLSDGMRAAQWFITNFGPPIMFTINLVVGAWRAAQPAIAAAIAFINTVIAQIGTFLQTQVLPVVYQAIGQVTTWWNDHSNAVATILGAIFGNVGRFFGTLQANMHAALDQIHGIWDVGWGLVSGSLNLVLDVMSGNWQQFGNDLTNMGKTIVIGILEIFNGLVDNTILIMGRLEAPISAGLSAVMHAAYTVSRYAAGLIFDVWNNLPSLILDALVRILNILPRVGHILQDWAFTLGQQLRNAIKGIIAPRTGAGGGGSSGFGLVGDDLVGQVAHDTRTARQKFIDALSAGWAPGQTLVFKVDTTQATKDSDAWFKSIEDKVASLPNPFTGKSSGYKSAAQGQAAGQQWVDDAKKWLLDLAKSGIKLPSLPDFKGVEQLPPLTAPPIPSTAPGPTAGKSPQEIALDLARSKYALDLASGHLTMAQGMADVAAIIKAERALPAKDRPNVYQLALDALTYTKDVDTKLLDVAKQHFDYDKGVAHPSAKALMQDENAILKVIAATPGEGGTKGYDYLLAKRDLDQQIKDAIAGKGPSPFGKPAPVPRYGALAGETGYGQTVVSFGGAQANPWQSMVAALREQITHLRAQLAKDDQLIALLEVGNATAGAELGELRSLHGTVRTPPPPQPAHSVNSHLKARGGFALVGRP